MVGGVGCGEGAGDIEERLPEDEGISGVVGPYPPM